MNLAIQKILDTSKITIKVENGFNDAGKAIYRNLGFSGLRADCSVEDLYTLAEAIKGILANNTAEYLLTEISQIVDVD
ncbi:hypothetical protein D3C73_1133120 [compost metagenome]